MAQDKLYPIVSRIYATHQAIGETMTFKVGDLVKYHNAYLQETRYGVVTAKGTIGLPYLMINFGKGDEPFFDVDDIEKIG